MVSWVLIGIIGLEVAVVKGFELQAYSEGDSTIIMIDREDLKDQNFQKNLEKFLDDRFPCETSTDGNKIRTTDDVTRKVVTPTPASTVGLTALDYSTNIPSSTSAEFEKTTSSIDSENVPPNVEGDLTPITLTTETAKEPSTAASIEVPTTRKDQVKPSSSPPVTTSSPTKASPSASNGSCIIKFDGICYWSHVVSDNYVNFKQAEETCSNKGSMPAYFPNKEVYNSVVQDLRLKIPSERTFVDVWTGITIDANTRQVNPPREDSYMKWAPGRPRNGKSWKTFTHVLLHVGGNPNARYGVMWDTNSMNVLLGVICQTTMQ